ncbi:sensor histidine kinase [Devosia sp. BSSL-BM10]|uniref:histidine kinase n=2 Tax=Devosia TaxID=46913 RepID=A0A942EEE1_9HYPH|nr:HWE histidine kinase domain-containing protein [Devosia litorisediminis]MBS3850440.1 sensor histidine kinase [Devosia litorisediminis]
MTGSSQNIAQPAQRERPRRRLLRSLPVATYLGALVLVILIPALVVSLVLINRNNQAQEEVVRSLTNATVQAVGQSVEREIAGMVTTLRVLSTSELLKAAQFREFHDRAATALAGTGAYLIALDGAFDQMLNTRVPYGAALSPTSDPATAAQAMQRSAPTVSGLFFGRTASRWVFNVLLQVPENEQVSLLVLTQNAENLAGALQSRQLPAGWHAALVDSGNLVVAATPDAGFETGNVLPMRQTQDQPPEEWQRERFDGQQVVTAEWRSALSGWRVIAWASTDAVDRPLGDALLWLAAWGVIIALAAALLAFLIAERIGISVRGLRRDAQRLGRGEPVAAKAYPVAEIAEVSRALADASASRQAADNEVRFLMREVAHRSKNQMTVIAAMARQTARGADDVPSYVQSFERRIQGLARSTDLLLNNGRAGVALEELVESQIAPFSPPDTDRVDVSGPAVRLNMQAAQILGMAVHELSTNAVKYGAFGEGGGTLSVRWTLSGETLDFVWHETVPQALTASDRVGFGTTVLKSMVGHSLGAVVERDCHETGMEWRFSIPLSAIDPEQMPPPPGSLLGE